MKSENIIFLLGAGISKDAKIPISNDMVIEIEKMIVDPKSEWIKYKQLYYYLRSSIEYSEGIFGNFNQTFNVERLLIVISEIEKRDRNIMYPFIGTWNIRLLDLAGHNFETLSEFSKIIRKQLNKWILIKNYNVASYYKAFISLSNTLGGLIKVFSLNYDLCFEKIVGNELYVENGFNKSSTDDREWHHSNFSNKDNKHFFLYKLHGSIDWYEDSLRPNKILLSDDPVEKPQLIFGLQNKMSSLDPYFFYSTEFRNALLEDGKLIVAIGYSFSDEHINNILSQAIREKDFLKLLCVSPSLSSEEIIRKLSLNEVNDRQIIVVKSKAKEFMLETLSAEYLNNMEITSESIPDSF